MYKHETTSGSNFRPAAVCAYMHIRTCVSNHRYIQIHAYMHNYIHYYMHTRFAARHGFLVIPSPESEDYMTMT